MFRPKVHAYAAVVSLCCVILGGCGAGNIVYRFEPPDKYQAVPIKGIPEKAEVIEMVDRLIGDCAQEDSLVLIVKEPKQLSAYHVSVLSGEASFLTVVTEPPTSSFYWEKFSQTGKTAGDVASGCFSTGCSMLGGHMSHVSERWGFEGERRFACKSEDRVLTSFQYVQKKEYTGGGTSDLYEHTYADYGQTLKFVINDNVAEISQANGYFGCANKGNTTRIRYYMMSDGNVLGCTPDERGSVGLTNVIVYDLKKSASWGAEMLMPATYLYDDFAVTPDGSLAVMLVGKPGHYQLLKYDASTLAKAARLYTTKQ